jgi:hypothetical protein
MARARRDKKRGEDALERLYAADPDQFVAERNRLAREFRDEGRDEEARELAALRKPPLPAFLANRLAREQPREMRALIHAAEKLSAAHRAGDAAKLRKAQAEHNDALRTLVATASQAAGKPVSDAVEQRLATTLRAASVDPEAASLLERGVLPDEVDPAGFDALAGMPVKRAQAKAKSEPTASSGRAQRAESARQARTERLESQLADANDELRSAERELKAAERAAERARRRVADLEQRLERAR